MVTVESGREGEEEEKEEEGSPRNLIVAERSHRCSDVGSNGRFSPRPSLEPTTTTLTSQRHQPNHTEAKDGWKYHHIIIITPHRLLLSTLLVAQILSPLFHFPFLTLTLSSILSFLSSSSSSSAFFPQ